MLKGIDTLLRGEVLHLLDDLGHTDTLLLADANFPLLRLSCPVIRLGEGSISRVLDAVLGVLPLDEPVDSAITRMIDDDDPEFLHESQVDSLTIMRGHLGAGAAFRSPPRSVFYSEALGVAGALHILEPSPASSLIVRKGVVHPVARP